MVNIMAERMNQFAKILSRCKKVNDFDDKKDKEAWSLAHSFIDLEESFKTLLNELFPKLIDKNIKEAEIEDTLLEIGEEFKHILYHIFDPKFFRYLPGPSDSGVWDE